MIVHKELCGNKIYTVNFLGKEVLARLTRTLVTRSLGDESPIIWSLHNVFVLSLPLAEQLPRDVQQMQAFYAIKLLCFGRL